jgi:putative PIN family toxin of toxin-antitoxin system
MKPMPKRIVRVFLDSNVILSGLLSDTGAPRTILDLITLKLPFLVGSTGRYNLIEIERNLKKKMPGILSVYKRCLPKLNLNIIPLPQPEEVREFSGKIANKDVPVLVSAIRSKADFLVTGDKQHFQKLKSPGNCSFKIVTPSEFIELVLPEVIKEIGKID